MGLFNNDRKNLLAESISLLTAVLRASLEQRKTEFDWIKSHAGLATKRDLDQMEDRMAIKVSELKTEVGGLRTQVEKIWGEQQTKYDALKAQFDALNAQLANQEVDAETQTAIDDFKLKLKEFDDTIPDTTT